MFHIHKKYVSYRIPIYLYVSYLVMNKVAFFIFLETLRKQPHQWSLKHRALKGEGRSSNLIVKFGCCRLKLNDTKLEVSNALVLFNTYERLDKGITREYFIYRYPKSFTSSFFTFSNHCLIIVFTEVDNCPYKLCWF